MAMGIVILLYLQSWAMRMRTGYVRPTTTFAPRDGG
jgi:hypothetical protein